MSGHSKWSTIKHKKAIIDAKRGGIFTKMANAITVAVKKGGGVGDPDMNFSLRLAVDTARSVNMPKENIERAIDKGMGKTGEKEVQELTIEGYLHGGVGIIIEAVSDNHNRTVTEIKNILEKNGGRLGEPGSVLYQFDRVGEICAEGNLSEDLELALIDYGMIDSCQNEGSTCVYSNVRRMNEVLSYLREKGLNIEGMSIVYRPKVIMKVDDMSQIQRVMDIVDAHEDVQEVYTNAE